MRGLCRAHADKPLFCSSPCLTRKAINSSCERVCKSQERRARKTKQKTQPRLFQSHSSGYYNNLTTSAKPQTPKGIQERLLQKLLLHQDVTPPIDGRSLTWQKTMALGPVCSSCLQVTREGCRRATFSLENITEPNTDLPLTQNH